MLAGTALYVHLSILVGETSGIAVNALLMTAAMAAGMTAWMAWRRHTWPAIAKMALAMYLTFAVLFPPHWPGALSAATLIAFGHVPMLPAMALAMLHLRDELPHRPRVRSLIAQLSCSGSTASGSPWRRWVPLWIRHRVVALGRVSLGT